MSAPFWRWLRVCQAFRNVKSALSQFLRCRSEWALLPRGWSDPSIGARRSFTGQGGQGGERAEAERARNCGDDVIVMSPSVLISAGSLTGAATVG